METTDTVLVERALRGDRGAFDTLVERYAPTLYRTAAMMIGNAADAQDVVQETLLGAFQGLSRFRGEASVKTWLARILVRQVARHRRSSKARRMRSLDGLGAKEQGHGGETAASDARMDAAALLAKLTTEHRDVLVLREIDGLTYDEMAEVLELPRGTVESRLFRARQALRAAGEEMR